MKLALGVFFIGTIASATEENINSKDGIKHFPKNEVQSGFAALPVLAVLCLASSGETHLEVHDIFGYANETFKLKQEYVNLNKLQNVTLKIANRVYVTNNVTLNKEFAESLKPRFGSDIQRIDFVNTATASIEINNWFDNETDHNITNILSPQDLQPNTSVIAVSAIYFHGIFENAFNKNKSSEIDFHISNDTSVKVIAMHGIGVYKYLESKSLNAKILELPFSENNTALYIILPNDTANLKTLVHKLMNQTFFSVETSEMAFKIVNICLPKFRIETKTCFKRLLESLNIKLIFNETKANLHNMLEKEQERVYVSEIVQKAVFEICECGANNATVYNNTDIQAEFRADRQFLFFVKKDAHYILVGVYNGSD